jgi:hypothetical protein
VTTARINPGQACPLPTSAHKGSRDGPSPLGARGPSTGRTHAAKAGQSERVRKIRQEYGGQNTWPRVWRTVTSC